MFQIAFIESVRRPRERVFCTSLLGSKKGLVGLGRYHNSNLKIVDYLAKRLLLPFLIKVLVRYRLISSYIEGDSEVGFNKGLFPITLVSGYFQDPKLVLGVQDKIRPQERYFRRPQEIMKAADGKKAVFLHVRRTDYAEFFLENGRTPVLPYSYYERALSSLGNVEEFHVYVVGDDQVWSREQFAWLPNKTFSQFEPLEDLALMSLCQGGIVSNSSFAWWGAQLSSKSAGIVAPLYWIGWNLGIWHPKTIYTEGFRYLPVETL